MVSHVDVMNWAGSRGDLASELSEALRQQRRPLFHVKRQNIVVVLHLNAGKWPPTRQRETERPLPNRQSASGACGSIPDFDPAPSSVVHRVLDRIGANEARRTDGRAFAREHSNNPHDVGTRADSQRRPIGRSNDGAAHGLYRSIEPDRPSFSHDPYARQTKLHHRGSKERGTFCTGLDQPDIEVRPCNGNQGTRDSTARTDIDERNIRWDSTDEHEAIDQVGPHVSFGHWTDEIVSSIPTRTECDVCSGHLQDFVSERGPADDRCLVDDRADTIRRPFDNGATGPPRRIHGASTASRPHGSGRIETASSTRP